MHRVAVARAPDRMDYAYDHARSTPTTTPMYDPMHSPRLALPGGWPRKVRAAMLQVISLAHYAAVYTRGWAADSTNQRVRLRAENERLRQEVALLREELRVKDSRMARIEPRHRPHYRPVDRMAILELKAARGWSLEQTAKAFLVTAATVASWMKRLDEDGPDALVQLPVPVNKFPDFVRYVVAAAQNALPYRWAKSRSLRRLPGRACISGRQPLAGCSRKSLAMNRPRPSPSRPSARTHRHGQVSQPRVARRSRPWCRPAGSGPLGCRSPCRSAGRSAIGWRWPIDHFSRRVMGTAVFNEQPTSEAVAAFLGRTIAKAGKAPRYIVCDRGKQFDCKAFRQWCRRKGIKPPRYGAIGQTRLDCRGGTVILTMKTLLACLLLVPYRRERFRRELDAIVEWYNEYRPHAWLGGRTPNEVYHGRYPANRSPTVRAARGVAAWFAVREALGIGARQSRREVDVGSHASTVAKSTCPSSP